VSRSATAADIDVTWHARADGTAHAFIRRDPGVIRSLCGQLPWPQSRDWPAKSRCTACETAAEERRVERRTRRLNERRKSKE